MAQSTAKAKSADGNVLSGPTGKQPPGAQCDPLSPPRPQEPCAPRNGRALPGQASAEKFTPDIENGVLEPESFKPCALHKSGAAPEVKAAESSSKSEFDDLNRWAEAYAGTGTVFRALFPAGIALVGSVLGAKILGNPSELTPNQYLVARLGAAGLGGLLAMVGAGFLDACRVKAPEPPGEDCKGCASAVLRFQIRGGVAVAAAAVGGAIMSAGGFADMKPGQGAAEMGVGFALLQVPGGLWGLWKKWGDKSGLCDFLNGD